MKIYLASSYSRRVEMQGHAEVLRAFGHEITSRWIDGSHELGDVATDEDRARLAEEDREDVFAADVLLSFTAGPHAAGKGRGGRHVELGMALSLRCIRKVVIGCRENVFHYLPEVEVFDSLAEWLAFEGEVV